MRNERPLIGSSWNGCVIKASIVRAIKRGRHKFNISFRLPPTAAPISYHHGNPVLKYLWMQERTITLELMLDGVKILQGTHALSDGETWFHAFKEIE